MDATASFCSFLKKVNKNCYLSAFLAYLNRPSLAKKVRMSICLDLPKIKPFFSAQTDDVQFFQSGFYDEVY